MMTTTLQDLLEATEKAIKEFSPSTEVVLFDQAGDEHTNPIRFVRILDERDRDAVEIV